MSLLPLLPGCAVAMLFVCAVVGALVARHVRLRTTYDSVVLGVLVCAPGLVFVPSVLVAPAVLLLPAVFLWLSFVAGSAGYVRTRWAQDAGVGELGAIHRERDGLAAFVRSIRRPDWRRQAVLSAASTLTMVDGARAVLGSEVARSDARTTGGVVTVKLGRRRPGAGGNSGVVGLLLGRPESGKTTTAIRLLFATAEADPGGSIIIVDPKGDRALRDAAKAIADRHQTRFWNWSISSPLDPLASEFVHDELAVQAVVARVMAAMTFTEPHYEGIALNAYTDAAQLLRGATESLSLRALSEVLTARGASALRERATAAARQGRVTAEAHAAIAAWVKRQDEARAWGNLAGAASRLQMIDRTGLGAQFATEDDGGTTISSLASTPGVAYLHLDAGMWPDAAKQIAELLAVAFMQDVGRIAQRADHTITLFIDEVGAVPARRMDAMLQRGRSAGFSVYLAAQTLGGIGATTPELVSQITGTLSWLIAHCSIGQSVGGEDDAERIGRLAGTRIELERTTQTSGGVMALPTGVGSQRQVDAYVIHPNLIRSLPRGQAVVVDVDESTASGRRGRLCSVAMYPPETTEAKP